MDLPPGKLRYLVFQSIDLEERHLAFEGATTTLPLYTYETAFSGFNLGKGAAIGVCWLVFLMIFSTIYNKVLSAKEVEY